MPKRYGNTAYRRKYNDSTVLPAELLATLDESVRKSRDLVEAARLGHFNKVVALLKEGLSVNADEYNKALFYASYNYVTPLQAAVESYRVECAIYLIQHGADVNCKDKYDVSALHVAAENGQHDILLALLEAGADCNLPTKYSKRGCYTAGPHCGGTMPLHLAAMYNHVNCLITLIQFGADYNAVDELGRNSLYICAQLGLSACILAHLRHAVGKDILSLPGNETGDTPLHFAVKKGMVNCVKELLRVGSDPNHLNHSGVTPLHSSVHPNLSNCNNSFEIMKLLVLNGHNVDVNQKDGTGYTPLHYVIFTSGAQFLRRAAWAEFLIQYGADLSIKSQRGCTVIESEIRIPYKDVSLLSIIVQSLKCPPSVKSLQLLMPPTPSPQPFRARNLFTFMTDHADHEPRYGANYEPRHGANHEPRHGANHEQRYGANQELIQEHFQEYTSLLAEPRPLQDFCRCSIREAMGYRRLRKIKDLPVPTGVQNYLLLMPDQE